MEKFQTHKNRLITNEFQIASIKDNLSSLSDLYSPKPRFSGYSTNRIYPYTLLLEKMVLLQKSDTTEWVDLLKDLIAKIVANHDAMHKNKLDRLDAVKEVLTLEQQAKYLIFEVKFMKEIAGFTKRAMRGERDRSRHMDRSPGWEKMP